MSLQRCAAIFVAWLAVVQPARSEGYPFAGFFVDLFDDEAPGMTAARCAISFFEQRADGSFGHYHLDNAAFRATGEIRYLRYREGRCSFDPLTRIETCHSTLDLSDRRAQVYDMFTVYGEIGANEVPYVYLDTLEDAQAFAAGAEVAGEAPDAGTYGRCPIDPALLRAHLAGDSRFSEGAIAALDDPSDALLAGDLPQAVLAKLRGPAKP